MGNSKLYTSIRVPRPLSKEIARIAAEMNVPKTTYIAMALPRCPRCGSLLIPLLGSKRYKCPKCGKEYRLEEVTG